jgi:ribosomal protein S18 acetylase RimI-like enzyme
VSRALQNASVREAGREDLPRFAELLRQEILCQVELAGFLKLRTSVDWNELAASKLGQPQTGILVADLGGRIVGFVELRIAGSVTLGMRLRALAGLGGVARKGFVEDLFVEAEARRGGHARALIRAAESWFGERGVTEILAGVWAPNRPSLELFKGMGFEPMRTIMRRECSAGSHG